MQTLAFGTWLKVRRKELDPTRMQLASQVGCAEIIVNCQMLFAPLIRLHHLPSLNSCVYLCFTNVYS